ncbi:Spo0B C-terminal domain-containing protein [Bacillus alkalicellulosilyticus]|uniref:Spo0B C-terminal domain-containing protein n=1 Tax=Alkalihalobacterium alkalicellulosilyticum TaxID=1912214 RepID=UPI000997F923|nr:Spo0B C-terminal domain-containing protein [Bacillus alkalicellulosilyticus]
MTKKWDDMHELLRHSRHDWLNVIQLIKGNIALKRLDRVEEIINEVINKAQNESKLSDLKIPLLAGELLTINWENHLYETEVEIVGEVLDLSRHEKILKQWCNNLIELFDEISSPSSENHLLITFDLYPKEATITFDFQGKVMNVPLVEEWIVKNKTDGLVIKESSVTSSEVYITVALV